MLPVNPAMIFRLDELETDLIHQRQQAEHHGWHGEVEGLDLTLSALQDKRRQAQRLRTVRPVQLGLPTPARTPGAEPTP